LINCILVVIDKFSKYNHFITLKHLVRAQHRMKVQSDKKRSDVSFQVGDKVFLKLQSYIQSSLARRAHQKLAFKFLVLHR
jgi:F0F1-type ATP synthase membrane subunit b/b'